MKKKKIKPSEQTRQLRKANWEFLKRRKLEGKKLDWQQEVGVDLDGEWEFWARAGFSNDEIEDLIERGVLQSEMPIKSAAIDCNLEIRWHKALSKNIKKFLALRHADNTKRQKAYRDYILADAGKILDDVLFDSPEDQALVAINLNRPKAVILAEIEKIIDLNLHRHKEEDQASPRLKWPALLDEYLQVWDFRWEQKTFKEIAKITKTTEDAAKKRFFRAYELKENTKYTKNTWKNLLRERLGAWALSEKPQEQKAWEKILKPETTYLRERLSDAKQPQTDSLGESLLFLDLLALCKSCRDKKCAEKTIACLLLFKEGDGSAFDDYQPHCPRLYSRLKNIR